MALPEPSIQQVEESPGEALGARLTRQNKAVNRLLKDPANDPARKMHEGDGPLRKLPAFRLHANLGGGVRESAAAYESPDFQHQPAQVLAMRLDGHSVMDHDSMGSRPLSMVDLYRSYKHTPHQPASVFLKYLVHRINNLDAYEDPAQAVGQDINFLKHHQKGGASEKNGHLVPKDLHVWMHAHPAMPATLLEHKAALHAELARGVGLNVRDIAGEPYVALSRGLNSEIMNHEHALSSWSDLVSPGFGKFTNHAWVPLKDLWYSYQYGPVDAQGDIGHENEYLVSHTGPRFEAEPHDVKAAKGHGNPRLYDNATDEELAKYAGGDTDVLKHPNAGPKTYAEVEKWYSGHPGMLEAYALPTKFRTREQALMSPLPASIRNPNLTTEDLGHKILRMSSAGVLDSGVSHDVLGHPSATAATARTLAGQYTPDGRREHILEDLAQSPLTPPDVLSDALSKAQQPDTRQRVALYVLRNPNHTSEQADSVIRDSLNRPGSIGPNNLRFGRYSPRFIKELSDQLGAGYGQEPLSHQYAHGVIDPTYKKALNEFEMARQRHADIRSGLLQMGANRDMDEDAQEAWLEVIGRHRTSDTLGALRLMAARQNQAPMSESMQLRLLRAGDAGDDKYALRELASAKSLAPSVVWALALHPDASVRDTIFKNRTVDPEVLAQAWPEKFGSPEGYFAQQSAGAIFENTNPYVGLAKAIVDRRAYAKRRAEEHLIKPWPTSLAKSETDWWPVKLREWMSSRAKPERGYYLRVPSLEQARAIVASKTIPIEPTDEILDGYVVLAQPAKDYYYHAWEKDPAAGDALVYFETDDPPLNHEGRMYWPHEVVASDIKLAGIRPSKLGKSEPISRGPAFNGEKDYRPDEAGDPQFPFQGGPRKEQSHAEPVLKLPGTDLEPGEHRTALAQLGHSDRYEVTLAAACFLARRAFDPDKFQQGLAVYGDEVRAALHAVDLADSEKNMRALGAIIRLQDGRVKALSKSEEPQSPNIYSIQPGNEDAVDTAEAVERAVRGGNVVGLKLSGKHSKGAMACRDPKTGKVFLLKPPGGKQSPAAGARDGKVGQARREACFWHIADKVHLGGAIPHADLIILNAQEWSAISLLGSDWKSLDEKNREKQYKGREVLGPYLANGQLHRWALLDWVLGNSDSHGQNLLVNNGGSVALIDHGAAFCGPNFDPAHDSKSFVPFYLRVWAPEMNFKILSPVDRIKHMPRLSRYEDEILKRWLVEDFTSEMTEREMRVYGVDDVVVKAVLARLHELRGVAMDPSKNLSEYVNGLWAGTAHAV